MSQNFARPVQLEEQPRPVLQALGTGSGRNPQRIGPLRNGFRWTRTLDRFGFVVVWTLSRRGVVFRQIACSSDCLWRGEGRGLVAGLLRQACCDMRVKP